MITVSNKVKYYGHRGDFPRYDVNKCINAMLWSQLFDQDLTLANIASIMMVYSVTYL